MSGTCAFDLIQAHLKSGGALSLFLDYDGTLVPIARTPDEAQPDAALLELLTQLAHSEFIHVAIISGRSLASLQAMLPVPAISLVGAYGIEIQMPGATPITRVDPKRIRPKIAEIKSAWQKLIAERSGYFLEDKGLSVALHARFADPQERAVIIPSAEVIARMATRPGNFQILGNVDFLEVAPLLANKGKAVEWLLDQKTFADGCIVYFGDDDKDAEAFVVVQQRGGYTIQVGNRFDLNNVTATLGSTYLVREWLGELVHPITRGIR